MKIAICDDELAQTELLSSLVQKWAAGRKMPLAVESFSSAEAFQFAWSEDKRFDLLLLDIHLPGSNGMELAQTIRKKDSALSIVFVTGFSDYAAQGYDVSALHYLVKPVREDQLFACLDRAVSKMEREPETLLLQANGEYLRFRQDEILFIEAFSHAVSLVTTAGRFDVQTSIGEIAAALNPAYFCKPHRSYIVGLKFVRKIGKTDLELDNNLRVPLSRRLYRSVNKAFIDFYRGEK